MGVALPLATIKCFTTKSTKHTKKNEKKEAFYNFEFPL